MAPVLAASQVVSEVVLGRTTTVLNGHGRGWIRGGRRPGGGCLGAGAAAARRGLPGGHGAGRRARGATTWREREPGVYTLWVDADDAAGNRSSAGPFEVQVTCADAAVKAVALTAEPSPAGGQWLTIRTTIRNTGPDAIPAGLPFAALWAR